jgi:hypothetical protein
MQFDYEGLPHECVHRISNARVSITLRARDVLKPLAAFAWDSRGVVPLMSNPSYVPKE